MPLFKRRLENLQHTICLKTEMLKFQGPGCYLVLGVVDGENRKGGKAERENESDEGQHQDPRVHPHSWPRFQHLLKLQQGRKI
jgi:hypothetical protein